MVDFSNILRSSTRVSVEAHWEPIADATYNLHQPTKEQFNRAKSKWPEPVDMEWRQALELFTLKPACPLKDYNTADFQVFLPSSSANVGDIWDLDSEEILPFFHQFHPGAKTDLRVYWTRRGTYGSKGKKGAKACLRALSPEYAEIVFRIHALFILDGPDARYTPAQFAGRLVINRSEGSVIAFTLSLPSRNSNVDINAFGSADIVFVPRMELIALSDASKHEIAWETAITAEEAFRKLKSAFYKFAKIEWTPIEDTVKLAKSKNRPIHALVLFGALDDESC